MSEASHYYAGGVKVPIEPDRQRVCVDLGLARSGPTLLRKWLRQARPKPVQGQLALLDRSALPAGVLEALEAASAVQPVFRHGEASLVALPEVRVEATRAQRRQLDTLVKNGPIPASIEDQGAGRALLRPLSGNGADAVALANALHEALQPELAQARFVRIVPRPAARPLGERGR
jgi:hypothetical protein